jgi:hypothetical protein
MAIATRSISPPPNSPAACPRAYLQYFRIHAQQRAKLQTASIADAEKAAEIVLAQYRAGAIDFTRVTLLEQTLVQQQDVLTQAQGEIVTGLIQVYRALGGGWQIRLTGCVITPRPPQSEPISAGTPTSHPKPFPNAESVAIPPQSPA